MEGQDSGPPGVDGRSLLRAQGVLISPWGPGQRGTQTPESGSPACPLLASSLWLQIQPLSLSRVAWAWPDLSAALSFKGKPPGQEEAEARVGCLPGPPCPGSRAPASLSGAELFPDTSVFSKRRGDDPMQLRSDCSVPLPGPWLGARYLRPSFRQAQQRGGAQVLCSLFNIPQQLCDGVWSRALNSCTSVPSFSQRDGMGPLVLPQHPHPRPPHWTHTGAQHR